MIEQSGNLTRRPNGTFMPGCSGNPRGRPATWDDMTALCREHTPLAIATLAEIAAEKANPAAARVAAATALLDRGHGRPPQAMEIGARRIEDVRELSDAELTAIIWAAQRDEDEAAERGLNDNRT
jgi:hypothetical protein